MPTKETVELMSPAKKIASLEAVASFADAVYFGTSDFNLRANSESLSLDDLNTFMAKCHEKEMRGYMTVNSTLYNIDLGKIDDLMRKAKKARVDAVIVWDPAAIEAAKKEGIDFFISTQANVSNWKAVNFYRSLGAKRVILAREVSLDQVKEIKKKTDFEIECFVHGAMCLAISGRCILSGFYEGSSANRGACTQICRRKFRFVDQNKNVIEADERCFFSPKDICMIEYIPEMIESGIDSFKIEGRQKSTRYARETAKYYRKAIDSYFEGTFSKKRAKKWKRHLKKVYNRKFSTGFYFGTPGAEGITFDSGSASDLKRTRIGFVDHFYTDSEVAVVNLKEGGMEVGNRIIIEGETTYLEQEVESLEIENESVQKATKGEKVGLKTKKKVRENDEVYRLIE